MKTFKDLVREYVLDAINGVGLATRLMVADSSFDADKPVFVHIEIDENDVWFKFTHEGCNARHLLAFHSANVYTPVAVAGASPNGEWVVGWELENEWGVNHLQFFFA